jgi:hypothetical protein
LFNLALREELILMVSENKMLRRIFRSKKREGGRMRYRHEAHMKGDEK